MLNESWLSECFFVPVNMEDKCYKKFCDLVCPKWSGWDYVDVNSMSCLAQFGTAMPFLSTADSIYFYAVSCLSEKQHFFFLGVYGLIKKEGFFYIFSSRTHPSEAEQPFKCSFRPNLY